jgi:hypothetical protein
MRLNYILFLGSFELDFEDGEIRFKTTLFYEDSDISDQVIEHLIVGNIVVMSNHFNLINNVITSKMDIKEAEDEIKQFKAKTIQK